VFAALISVFLTPIVFSQPCDGWNLKRLESKLNLSDTQKEQIEKLRLDHQKAMVELKAKLEKAEIELREVTSKADFSRSDYLATHNKIAKIREEIQLAAANHRMDVLDLMNKDQRKLLLDELKFEKGKKFLGMKGRGRCGFDGPRDRDRKRIHW
jgi:Spy/CpxP family protein refolding chaperone